MHAQPTFSPAHFSNQDKSLQNLIEFPSISDEVDIVIPCVAIITPHGKFKYGNNACHSKPNSIPEIFETNIHQAAKAARIMPAMIENGRMEARFHYSVRFLQNDKCRFVTLYPNHGKNVANLGNDYISAQLIRQGPNTAFDKC